MSVAPPADITPRDVQEIAGVVPDEVGAGFASALGIEQLGGGDGMDVDVDGQARGFDGVRRKVKEIIREGYSASQIISQVRSSMFFASLPPHLI